MEQKENKLPSHTRFGLRLLQVLIIVLCMVLVKRCVNIYYENRDIDEQAKVEYFARGLASDAPTAEGKLSVNHLVDSLPDNRRQFVG